MRHATNKRELEKRVKRLRVQYRSIGEAIGKLGDEIRRRFVDPEKAKCVGKCYKFHNSSGGKKWWLYRRIVDFKNGAFWTVEIQQDDAGLVDCRERRWDTDAKSIYTEISQEEYRVAVTPLLSTLQQRVCP